jgi:hypothetical protein
MTFGSPAPWSKSQREGGLGDWKVWTRLLGSLQQGDGQATVSGQTHGQSQEGRGSELR